MVVKETLGILFAFGCLTSILFPWANAAQRAEKPSGKAKILVSLLLYSGRPDPQWEITQDSDIERLRNFLKDIPPADAPSWPTLGWRGFLLANQGIVEVPQEVRVFEGVIRVSERGVLHYYQDKHGLEDWLRKQAGNRGFSKLIPKPSSFQR